MGEMSYRGSGPYCYVNSLAMMMGGDAPEVGVLETVTGSPFGMALVGGSVPYFDPYGWTPEIGVGDALAVLGWSARTVGGGDAEAALARLDTALAAGPVMVGPVEMGYLRYQPGMAGPIGADHYLVVVGIEGEHVVVHDPQGYPYARLPLVEFLAAWRADTVTYGEPYTLRTDFTRLAHVGVEDAVTAVVPRAIDWLTADPARPMPPGSLANGAAALALAELIVAGDPEVRDHLVHFAIRVGARRLVDAATCLRGIGYVEAAGTMDRQARLVGALQHAVITGETDTAAAALRALAPTYDRLRADLEHGRSEI